tara:strand:- start:752 stop:877 length:126 start_codon:yes stop_codon:yes gene_type:complete
VKNYLLARVTKGMNEKWKKEKKNKKKKRNKKKNVQEISFLP